MSFGTLNTFDNQGVNVNVKEFDVFWKLVMTFTILRVERRVEKMEHAIGEMGSLLILKVILRYQDVD